MSLTEVFDKLATSAATAVAEVPPEETTAAVPPAAEEPTVKPAEGETKEPEVTEPEGEVDLDAIPESSGDFPKYKPLFKEHPELRNILGREKAYSELGAFSEVRSIIERVPTITDAEQLVSDAENKRELGQTFREDPIKFAESLKESDPQAFSAFAKQLPQVLAETAPELYSEHARFYVNNAIDFVFAMAQRSGNQELAAAVQKMASEGLGYQIGSSVAQPRAENTEAAKLRKQLQDRDRSDAEAEFNSFWQQTDEVITGASVSAIEDTLKKALPDATPAQIERMKKESYGRLLETIGAQPQVVAQNKQYRDAAMKGKRGIAEHKAIVAFMTNRAKLVIPRVTKAVIDEWTKDVISQNKSKTDKQKAIAAGSKDVGTGPQGTTSAAAPTTPNNGKPRSAQQIMAELESGNYVKR